MNIQEVRAKFPQYGDLSDTELADALHSKFYADMPKAEFYGKVGLSTPSFGEKASAVARATWEGLRSPARFAEQLIGKAGIPVLSEAARWSDEEARGALAQARKTAPVGAAIGEITGAVLNPMSIASMGILPGGAGFLQGGLRGAGQGAMFGATQPVENPDNMLAEKGQQLAWSTGGGALFGGAAGALQSRAANRVAQGAANATQDAAAQAARSAGYTLPPVTTNPTFGNRMLEGLAGKLTTAQQASINNQQVTNALVRKALGLADDAPITKETLAALRRDAGAAYEAVASVPQPFVPTDALRTSVDRLRAESARMTEVFPSLVNKDVTALLDDLASATQFDPRVAVEASKRMRFESSQIMRNPMASPQQTAYARTQREAAKQLEDMIAKNLDDLGLKDLFGAWQAARIQIAKVKNVERAVNDSTGNVIAAKLGQQLDRGAPLTGELRTVAEAAKAFPKATREVTESMPGISPLDYFVGGGLGASTGNPLAMLAPLARPVARSAILSPAYQRMFGMPSYATGLFGEPLAQPLLSGAGAAGLLSYGTP